VDDQWAALRRIRVARVEGSRADALANDVYAIEVRPQERLEAVVGDDRLATGRTGPARQPAAVDRLVLGVAVEVLPVARRLDRGQPIRATIASRWRWFAGLPIALAKSAAGKRPASASGPRIGSPSSRAP
jgi:hypothetical protein